jgi:hypothetical protein
MADYAKPLPDDEFRKLIENEPFASGQSRDVYRLPSDNCVIVKVVKNGFPGPNFIEWNIWHSVVGTSLEPIFGRCITISPTGIYLMMEFLSDTEADDVFPRIPTWLTDRKRSAFGKDATGSVKIRDYAGLKLGPTLEAAPREVLPIGAR